MENKTWENKIEYKKEKCIRCKSDRILDINGKTSDCFDAVYKGKEYNGYVLSDVGLGDDSDCIIFKYCLMCGQIQGKFPVSEKKLNEQIEDSEEG